MQQSAQRKDKPFVSFSDGNTELTDLFRPATEFYGFEGRGDPDGHENPFAKSIVWYDAANPVFVCEAHYQAVQSIERTGPAGRPDDYTARREAAYRRLFCDHPPCDVCTGRIRTFIGGNGVTIE